MEVPGGGLRIIYVHYHILYEEDFFLFLLHDLDPPELSYCSSYDLKYYIDYVWKGWTNLFLFLIFSENALRLLLFRLIWPRTSYKCYNFLLLITSMWWIHTFTYHSKYYLNTLMLNLMVVHSAHEMD